MKEKEYYFLAAIQGDKVVDLLLTDRNIRVMGFMHKYKDGYEIESYGINVEELV